MCSVNVSGVFESGIDHATASHLQSRLIDAEKVNSLQDVDKEFIHVRLLAAGDYHLSLHLVWPELFTALPPRVNSLPLTTVPAKARLVMQFCSFKLLVTSHVQQY